jgi:hypothetical protein
VLNALIVPSVQTSMHHVVLSVVVILEPLLHPARISVPRRVTIRRAKTSALLALQHQVHVQR